MRVRVVVIVLAAVAPWALAACSHEDDGQDAGDCPTVSAEEMWESEEGRAYLRELGKVMGETVDGPEDLDRLGYDESDAYTTSFTVGCDD